MSETSSFYQSNGSVGAKDLSQNDSQSLLRHEVNITKNENESINKLNKSIGTETYKDKSNSKDNFNLNFFNLKSEKRFSNENNFVNSKEDEENQNNVMTEICSSENKCFNIKKDSVENDSNEDLRKSRLTKGNNEKVINSYSAGETDGVVMKAALSRVAERLGLSSPKENPGSSQIFYGVYIPSDSSMKSSDEETLHVYTEKSEALKVMKQSKKARLKQFKTKKEAVNFVIHGSEAPTQTNSVQSVSSFEKVMPFKCPKIQDMISFKKAIENGDAEEVRKKILDNPRYLVSSGDTPSILQEGSRYNALHIAAKSKNVEIVRLILESVTNMEFISYMYDDNDANSCKERIEVLLDLYLNMPDKGLNETPLHIAVKNGAVDVVEYLISYPQCQRNLLNKFQQQPKDIICSRVNNPSEAVKQAISDLLDDQFYIPVLRYEDNSIQPRVGEPFSPSKPLNLSEDLLSPRIEVQAYAGPMNKEFAEVFKKKWKSPPRSAKDSSQCSSVRLRDMEKGLERIGRNLALELKVPWKEYWPFLDTFIDLASVEGLQMLECYLKNRFKETLEMVSSGGNSNNSETNEKVISPISALCEVMRFCSLNDDPTSPAKRLKWNTWNSEKYESHRKLDENIETDARNPLLYVERSCEVFGKRIASAIASFDLYGVHTDCMRDSLEIQIKHLMSNILSYREDSRFQCVNFQMIHSRVAAVAVYSLEDFCERDRSRILNCLQDIDRSDGTLSDDEDLCYNYRYLNQELIGNSVKEHLHCLVKNLIFELNDFDRKLDVSATARNEADCTRLWSLATPCFCSWGLNTYLRPRIGIKRKSTKYVRSSYDCDIRSAFRRVLTEEITETELEKKNAKADDKEVRKGKGKEVEVDEEVEEEEEEGEEEEEEGEEEEEEGEEEEEEVEEVEEEEEVEEVEEEEEVEEVEEEEDEEDDDDAFVTPPSGHSDSEEENMEEPLDLPDTFIYEGSVPTKMDYAVLEVIEALDLSFEKYPNIIRWKHLVTLHSKNSQTSAARGRPSLLNSANKKRYHDCTTPNSSPGKALNKSLGACDISRRSGGVEPWERILGPYSPCTPKRSSLSLAFNSVESSFKR